jgi:hypothetical protein
VAWANSSLDTPTGQGLEIWKIHSNYNQKLLEETSKQESRKKNGNQETINKPATLVERLQAAGNGQKERSLPSGTYR